MIIKLIILLITLTAAGATFRYLVEYYGIFKAFLIAILGLAAGIIFGLIVWEVIL